VLVFSFAAVEQFYLRRSVRAGSLAGAMSPLSELTAQLSAGRALSLAQVETAAAALAATAETDDTKAALLAALAAKGETAAEVAAFATAFRARAVNPGVEAWAPRAIVSSAPVAITRAVSNISSMVVLTLASAGVTVMKHGNRGITSKCGSADLMAALGVNLEAPPEKLRRALDELGYVFFFAPGYHPAFKNIGPVRKALAARGQRTIFNILGPLINPGRPAHVLLGVFSAAWVDRLATALEVLGVQAGLAAHGVIGPERGIDEFDDLDREPRARLRPAPRCRRRMERERFRPGADAVRASRRRRLAANLAIVDALLAGRGPAGLVDTIALNAAVALWITGKLPDGARGRAAGASSVAGRRGEKQDRGDEGILPFMSRKFSAPTACAGRMAAPSSMRRLRRALVLQRRLG